MPRKSTTFYCFSPGVMIATLLFEVGAVVYVIWRYHMTAASRLTMALLASLAIFQLAEYLICGGAGLIWAKIGFVSITLLPPLGLHLASVLAKRKSALLVSAAYFSAACFAGVFLFVTNSISQQVCSGNYVIFVYAPGINPWYSIYYYGWLILGTAFSLHWSKQVKSRKNAKALVALTAGYVLFILPTTTANVIDPSTIRGIPSIMCGFAVILAFVLVYWVVPLVGRKRQIFRKF